MKKGKIMRYTKRMDIENFVIGTLWVVCSALVWNDSILGKTMNCIALLALIYSLLAIIFAKTEKADEMAEQNLNRAKAFALECMLLLGCLVAIVALMFLDDVVLNVNIDKLIRSFLYAEVGVCRLLTGFAFRKYEGE